MYHVLLSIVVCWEKRLSVAVLDFTCHLRFHLVMKSRMKAIYLVPLFYNFVISCGACQLMKYQIFFFGDFIIATTAWFWYSQFSVFLPMVSCLVCCTAKHIYDLFLSKFVLLDHHHSSCFRSRCCRDLIFSIQQLSF